MFSPFRPTDFSASTKSFCLPCAAMQPAASPEQTTKPSSKRCLQWNGKHQDPKCPCLHGCVFPLAYNLLAKSCCAGMAGSTVGEPLPVHIYVKTQRALSRPVTTQQTLSKSVTDGFYSLRTRQHLQSMCTLTREACYVTMDCDWVQALSTTLALCSTCM